MYYVIYTCEVSKYIPPHQGERMKSSLTIILFSLLCLNAKASVQPLNSDAQKLQALFSDRWLQCQGDIITDHFIAGADSKTGQPFFIANDGSAWVVTQLSVGENVIISVGMNGAEEDGRYVLIMSSDTSEQKIYVDQISYDENAPAQGPSKLTKAVCEWSRK
jgi:hypothetical protein